jgi:thymidylate synthase
MNKLDKQYTNLLQDIISNGVTKQDRTGTGTISVFGRQIRHKMSEGYPLLTTKKMPFKTIVTELLWFLRGDTNIKFLVDNNCHIWDGDAYKNYTKEVNELIDGYMSGDIIGTQPHIDEMFNNPDDLTPLTKEEFIRLIKTDDEFAKKWGELGPIYGKQWRRWDTYEQYRMSDTKGNRYYGKEQSIDQIQNLINDLKTNPDSRRLMVNAWNVGELDQMVLPPCHYGFQVYTRELSTEERLPKKIKLKGHGDEIEFSLTDKREIKYRPKNGSLIDDLDENWLITEKMKDNEVFYQSEWGWGVFVDVDKMETISYDGTDWGGQKLNLPTRAISLMWNQRSVDTPLGLPFNIASYALLLELLALEVNMVPDELIGNLGDCHIYLNQIDGVKEQLTREPMALGQLTINDEFWNPNVGVFEQQDLQVGDFYIEDYQSHPAIKFPLSN